MEEAIEAPDTEEELRRIYWGYAPRVHSFFLLRGFSEEDAADLTQEVFLRVHRNLGGFRAVGEVGTWIFQIARRVWHNELRYRYSQKRAATEVSLDDAPEERDLQADVLAGLLASERSDLLQRAIAELPPQMRRCVELRVHQDLKYREIAVLLDIRIDTVKATLFQARQILEDKLGGYFADPTSLEPRD